MLPLREVPSSPQMLPERLTPPEGPCHQGCGVGTRSALLKSSRRTKDTLLLMLKAPAFPESPVCFLCVSRDRSVGSELGGL